jgi:hypothetical protein
MDYRQMGIPVVRVSVIALAQPRVCSIIIAATKAEQVLK